GGRLAAGCENEGGQRRCRSPRPVRRGLPTARQRFGIAGQRRDARTSCGVSSLELDGMRRSGPRARGSMVIDDLQMCGVLQRRSALASGPIQPARDGRGARRGSWAGARTLLGIGTILLVGCAGTNHHLIHPRKPPPGVIVWSADFARDDLRVHIEGARPPGVGPFPTILVHPEEEATASDMHGVIWDLAAHGYVAIAADYQR